jgi:hypothetical protein
LSGKPGKEDKELGDLDEEMDMYSWDKAEHAAKKDLPCSARIIGES